MKGRATVELIGGSSIIGDIVSNNNDRWILITKASLWLAGSESDDGDGGGQYSVPASSILYIEWVDKQVFGHGDR